MNLKIKLALLAITTVGVAFQSASCILKFLGDVAGDALWLRGID
jgi:hypothetical protein